ncbi:MAG TPA: hypothetical protein VHZ51_12125 [Ktedonobacteraceae bacterium]|jgi:hypothetical protein|nr:hypothetical protein [Ktedonobacteraceae bacterium]
MYTHDADIKETSNQRPWLIVAAWFGTIAFVGLLKHVLERQNRGRG